MYRRVYLDFRKLELLGNIRPIVPYTASLIIICLKKAFESI